jgi:porin
MIRYLSLVVSLSLAITIPSERAFAGAAGDASDAWGMSTSPAASSDGAPKVKKKKKKKDASRAPASFKPDSIFQQIDKKNKLGQPPARTTPEVAQPTDQTPAEGEDSFGMTGDWGGLRKKLEKSGVSLSAVYKGDWLRNFKGGAGAKSMYMDNLDLKVLIDADKALGAKGFTFFLYGLGNSGANRGASIANASGASQGADNIEVQADDLHLYEAWFQYLSEDNHYSVLFGLHDLNSEFYVTDSASLFINPSFGIGADLSQTGINGPSIFPKTSTALRLRFEPSKQTYAQTAIFNATAGNPDIATGSYIPFTGKNGYLMISEAGLTGTETSPYKVALGWWSYTHPTSSPTETVTDSTGNTIAKPVGNAGAYFLADKSLTPNTSVFLRFGIATAESNSIRDNLSGGFVFKGLLPKRPEDRVGIGFTLATPSDNQSKSETAIETLYRVEVLKGLALIPEFQYISHPGMSANTPNATLGGLRVEMSL